MIRHLISSYNNLMTGKPLIGNMITSGICYGCGDALAQKIEKANGKRDKYDFSRMTVYTMFGFLCGGPAYYLWFKKLHHLDGVVKNFIIFRENNQISKNIARVYNKRLSHLRLSTTHDHVPEAIKDAIKKTGHFLTAEEELLISKLVDVRDPVVRSKTVMAIQIMADQFIFSALYPFYFIIITATLLALIKDMKERKKIENNEQNEKYVSKSIYEHAVESTQLSYKKWWQIYSADLMVFPMIQLVNFAFIPPHLNVMYISVVNIFWNAYLCYVGSEH
jgi:hypothetical protein